MPSFTLDVHRDDSGLRLDKFLLGRLPGVSSRARIQRLIKEGKVSVNDKQAKANYVVREHDRIDADISFSDGPPLSAEEIPLEIVYEDDDLLVVNKPAGMVTHPAPGHYSATLVNAVMYHSKNLSTVNEGLRPGIVHRLDKDTSGLLIVAKNNASHNALAQQFEQHTIKRRYIAVVEGVVQFDEGVIDMPIGRHPRLREKMAVGFQKAREARTVYKTLKRLRNCSLLELSPHTGRTHQLRVHLSHIGHPVVGDKKYGKIKRASRLALHAQSIGFVHPRTGAYLEFSSDVPLEIEKIIQDCA